MATFVLVHGGWIGGWCWRRLVPLLAAAGHETFAPTLTGFGDREHLLNAEVDLNTHIQDVVALLETEELSGVVLVGQSYAGMVITGVAERVPERIASLVYLDAFVPGDGQSLADLVGPQMMATLREQAQEHGDGWRVPPLPPEACGVTEPRDVEWMRRRMGFHPLRTMLQALSVRNPSAASLPRTFIYCSKPPMGFFEPFAAKARAEGWKYRELPAGHSAMITAPRELAAMLMEVGETGRSRA
jgi:pimeloyl-ACP methyl ester carboxylesterase